MYIYVVQQWQMYPSYFFLCRKKKKTKTVISPIFPYVHKIKTHWVFWWKTVQKSHSEDINEFEILVSCSLLFLYLGETGIIIILYFNNKDTNYLNFNYFDLNSKIAILYSAQDFEATTTISSYFNTVTFLCATFLENAFETHSNFFGIWLFHSPLLLLFYKRQLDFPPGKELVKSWKLLKPHSSQSFISTAAAKSLQSCSTLCDPRDGSPPGSPIPGILQAGALEWVAISFSNAWKWKVKVKSLSRVQLFATPWTAAYQAPLSMGFSRQENWSGVPSPSPSLALGNV